MEYSTMELSLLVPELVEAGIRRILVQRLPETRIHCILQDGSVAMLVHEPLEDLRAWFAITSSGIVEDGVVLPGADGEDRVYYVVQREINGAVRRHFERWAQESECRGKAVNKQADSLIVYEPPSATTVIGGLGHLEGEEVCVWLGEGGGAFTEAFTEAFTVYQEGGTGADAGIHTVRNGVVTLDKPFTGSAVAGLPYSARYRSGKLAFAATGGGGSVRTPLALAQKKRVSHLALVLLDTHSDGLRYGRGFDAMEPLPRIINGREIPENSVWEEIDTEALPLQGEWSTDSRLCLEAHAPRPCTVSAAVIGMQTNMKD